MRNGEHRTGEHRLAAVEKQRQALELRQAGAPYRTIADRLGYSLGGAHKAVCTALERTLQEPAHQLRQMEAERLDALQAASWLAALQGDHRAFDRVLRVMERRAALLGLDAPKTASVLTAGVQLTDAERERIWVMLGLGEPEPPKEVKAIVTRPPCGLKVLEPVPAPEQPPPPQEAPGPAGEAPAPPVSDATPGGNGALSMAELEAGLDALAEALPPSEAGR